MKMHAVSKINHKPEGRTSDDELQVEGVLSRPVTGDAGVDAGVAARHGLDHQRVHAVLPDQHLVGGVRADVLPVELPVEVGCGQAAHLWGHRCVC